MLYPTHKKYGQMFGLVGIGVGAQLGLMPSVEIGDGGLAGVMGDTIVVLLYAMVAYRAGLFGAEFPDIDSHGSIPAQRHPVLQKIFQYTGVKHRGKFSHDFGSLLLFFGMIYLFVDMFLGNMMTGYLNSGVGNSELMPLVYLMSGEGILLSLVKVYVVFTLIGAYSHLIADASTKQGVWILWRIPVHIVPVFITRIEIGGNRPFAKIFNTGTGWEMFNRKALTYVFVPISVVFCIMSLFIL